MRLATLTSGGDCPGLNAVIRGIVRTASAEYGSTVVGYQDGWVGLMEDRRVDLYDDAFIDSILLRGGTILGTSRANPFHDGADGAEIVEVAPEVDPIPFGAGSGHDQLIPNRGASPAPHHDTWRSVAAMGRV